MRGIHWFRSDLRLRDNPALSLLADRAEAWLAVFVLDPEILARHPESTARTRFLLDCVASLAADLEARGVSLRILEGRPERVLADLAVELRCSVVSYNRAVTPLAERRDARVDTALRRRGVEPLVAYDRTVFGADEVRTRTGGAFSVYTPYRRAWWTAWHAAPRLALSRIQLPKRAIALRPGVRAGTSGVDSKAVGRMAKGVSARPSAAGDAKESQAIKPGEAAARRRLARFLADSAGRYAKDRDRPGIDGTSRLSAHLRFGTISARECFTRGLALAQSEPSQAVGIRKWLDELVWREFYHAVLAESPHVLTRNFRPQWDRLAWNDDESGFLAWTQGRTGYPFVDAGMRQLAATGWMHNRARMVVASFLSKHLLIDWRRGERHFARTLVDWDPASNNGGWQWAASTGCDAQPYFRIFNPVLQGRRFDPDGGYVRRWLPELRELPADRIHAPWAKGQPPAGYPTPIVDHATARARALAAFRAARGGARHA